MNAIMTTTAILMGVSVVLLAIMLAIYVRNSRRVKSKLLWGLMLFAIMFLIQNIVSLYYYFTMMDYYVPEVQTHVFILTLLQAVAFAVMLKITWE